jgi:hypothetical protein
MFDRNKTAQYGYEDSYRKTRFGVMCGTPPALTPYADSNGTLSMCTGATVPPGIEYDVHRYIDFFTKPKAHGGLKNDPNDVALAAIVAPTTPFSVILSNPATQGAQPYVTCPNLDETSVPPCVPVLQHSCMNAASAVAGDPAVRITEVVTNVTAHAVGSICDSDYLPTLTNAAALGVSLAMNAGCVPAPLTDTANPSCSVSEGVANGPMTSVPSCATSAGAKPCWRVEPKTVCSNASPQGVGVTIDRAAPPPTGTIDTATCTAKCN